MGEIKIERSISGGFCCTFFIGEQEYLGSLVIVSCCGEYRTECIIFKAKNKQFSFEDALGEHTVCDIDFTPDALRAVVNEFIESRTK